MWVYNMHLQCLFTMFLYTVCLQCVLNMYVYNVCLHVGLQCVLTCVFKMCVEYVCLQLPQEHISGNLINYTFGTWHPYCCLYTYEWCCWSYWWNNASCGVESLSIVVVLRLVLTSVAGRMLRIFTTADITTNRAFIHFGFIVSPVHRGFHWTNPPMIASTATTDKS